MNKRITSITHTMNRTTESVCIYVVTMAHPLRLAGFDYRDCGTYFITICTNNRDHIFGEIRNGMMKLSEMGYVVVNEIYATTIVRPYVHIKSWIMMPNHMHLLLHIGDVQLNDRGRMARHAPAGTTIDGATPSFGKPQSQSLSTIIGGFKSAVTKHINESRNAPGTTVWQRNFHEHIVRSQDECDRIRAYIRNNPRNWRSHD